jgi:hypothetical protein
MHWADAALQVSGERSARQPAASAGFTAEIGVAIAS